MDDIILYTNTEEEIAALIKEVLKIMTNSSLYTKKLTVMSDYAFALGYIINYESFCPNPEKV